MSVIQLNQNLLDNRSWWQGKKILLPKYDRKQVMAKCFSFSAGRMAYGHTGDILQDLLDIDHETGTMIGIETYSKPYYDSLAESDFLMTQLIFENRRGEPIPKIQGAMKNVLFVDGNIHSPEWNNLIRLAREKDIQFATINAPEGVYGVSYAGGEFAEAISPVLRKDMETGSINSDPAKWTTVALERFKAGLNFALVSCTNFSGNGHYTGATVRTVAREWEERGFAPKGFVAYLSDPVRFSFPNTMIDRIAVSPDDNCQRIMDSLGIKSNLVVTERCRYWAVEDIFPAGRPALEKAEGVFMCPDYDDVKRYEDMKLRILNMSHSVIAHLGVLLGYRGKYGIYNAMQDKDIAALLNRIIKIVLSTIERPGHLNPEDFARDAIERLNNPNIPDDPMRIAFNGSTKMKPRFMDTFFSALKKGIPEKAAEIVLLPVAGFLRYSTGMDDTGIKYELEKDPLLEVIADCGKKAVSGNVENYKAFVPIIGNKDVMGCDLYSFGNAGKALERITGSMLKNNGAVRATIRSYLSD